VDSRDDMGTLGGGKSALSPVNMPTTPPSHGTGKHNVRTK